MFPIVALQTGITLVEQAARSAWTAHDHQEALALRCGAVVGAQPAYAWTAADYEAEIATAKALGMRPADLLLVMFSESRLQPWAAYPGNVAVGLIQITKAAASAMGMTEPQRLAIVSQSPAQQMPTVARYFHAVAGSRAFEDAGAIYQAVAAPGTLSKGSGNGVELYPAGSQAAAANIGLDHDGDGAISVRDLRAHLAGLSSQAGYQHALAELRGVDPSQEGPTIGGGFTAGVVPAPKVPPAVARSDGGAGIGLAVAAIAGVLVVRAAR